MNNGFEYAQVRGPLRIDVKSGNRLCGTIVCFELSSVTISQAHFGRSCFGPLPTLNYPLGVNNVKPVKKAVRNSSGSAAIYLIIP